MPLNLFDLIQKTYACMDAAWDEAAQHYGFQCNGCKNNCCTSLFFHHTWVEKAFLAEGFKKLDPMLQKDLIKKAQNYINRTFKTSGNIQSKKIICPANKGGKCLLYMYRPMICRLHGLPHELHLPSGQKIESPGCEAGAFDTKTYFPFDRTPLYQMMSKAEMTFRQQTGKSGKIKQTIAHMLMGFEQ